jgi:F-type H+-transporting ATPase subunit epsilon
MAKTFHLTIAKVGEHIFDGEVVSVSLPGNEGVFQVLAGHEAFVSELSCGNARVVTPDEKILTFEVAQGGIAEVSNNQTTVLL